MYFSRFCNVLSCLAALLTLSLRVHSQALTIDTVFLNAPGIGGDCCLSIPLPQVVQQKVGFSKLTYCNHAGNPTNMYLFCNLQSSQDVHNQSAVWEPCWVPMYSGNELQYFTDSECGGQNGALRLIRPERYEMLDGVPHVYEQEGLARLDGILESAFPKLFCEDWSNFLIHSKKEILSNLQQTAQTMSISGDSAPTKELMDTQLAINDRFRELMCLAPYYLRVKDFSTKQFSGAAYMSVLQRNHIHSQPWMFFNTLSSARSRYTTIVIADPDFESQAIELVCIRVRDDIWTPPQ
jgi:hypothetical protein